ncbi:MAG: hypothetical protein CL532_05775, partial [Aestuariivita sp.]|nr:hypothetical protein [Aestuariivita sp.]
MSVYVIAEFPMSETGAQDFIAWAEGDNGYNIGETMKNNNKDLFDILSKIDVPGKYIGDGV